MIEIHQVGDHTIQIQVDAKVVSVTTVDPNVIAYLKRIARNCGVAQMIAEARSNGLTVIEQQYN